MCIKNQIEYRQVSLQTIIDRYQVGKLTPRPGVVFERTVVMPTRFHVAFIVINAHKHDSIDR